MSDDTINNAYTLLQEAVDCANAGNSDRARTLALISIAASLISDKAHDHHHGIDSHIADLAEVFFTEPQETTFADLQLALNERRKNISG